MLNFVAAPRKYAISGRVVDSNNAGVSGVSLILSRSETAITRSDANGNYSLSATVLGNYTVSAAIEQDYCTFAPTSQSVVNLIGDRVFNYTATFKPLPDPQQVLEFDGTQKTVDYGNFWPAYTELGPFFWEFWAMPMGDAGATYMLSDGYGGLHALLFGVASLNSSEPNRYEMSGNVNDGMSGSSHIFSFGSDSGPMSRMGPSCSRLGWTQHHHLFRWCAGWENAICAAATVNRHRQRQGAIFDGRFGSRQLPRSNCTGSRLRRQQTAHEPGWSNPALLPKPFLVGKETYLAITFRLPRRGRLSRGYLTGSHAGVPRGTTAGILGDCGRCPPPNLLLIRRRQTS